MIEKLFHKKKSLILVVDDSALMRATFREFLEDEGYEVLEAEDGMRALYLFSKIRPDIVLMDFIMPGINGVDTCAKLRELPGGSEIPVIVVTGLEDEKSVNLAFEGGATDYISKPINWAVLRQRLNRLIKARHTEKNLNQSEAFARSIIDHAADGILTTDEHGIIHYINPATERILGYSSVEIVGQNISIIFPKFDYTELNGKQQLNKEEIAYHKNSTKIPMELTASSYSAEDNLYLTIIMRDVTQRKHYEDTIKFQALYDSLTGLPNRRLLKKRIRHEIASSEEQPKNIAVMFLDLDRFKFINDTLGHEVGDKLLKEIAKRLRLCVGNDDIIARIGGDEFVILLPNFIDENSIKGVAHKILDKIKKPIEIDNHEVFITISIGIAVYPKDGNDDDTLISNADMAMYRAKEEGKNNVQIFTPSLNAKITQRLAIENNLRKALENDEFIVHYQPKVNGQTAEIVGMEALIRWNHPKNGLISPMTFIPVAEETGMIVPIGEWVLRTACAQNKALQISGLPPITVAVNLSSRQFELQDLGKTVASILEETGLEAKYLELEITESIAMQNIDHTLKVMSQLSEIGVKFSIDDFGTGYSSLSQLNNFSVNKLKIDKSFVEKIGDNSVIASTVLALGKNLQLVVVAEGVENEEQAAFFKKNNCDEMQGYYFGRPMLDEDFYKFYCEKLKIG